MSYTVVRHETRPIVIVHISGELNGVAHFRIAQKASELLMNQVGKVYLVIDLTGVRLDLLDMIEVVTQMTRGWAGTLSDPRVIMMMALDGGNSSLAAAHLVRSWDGWRRVFVFPSLAQALACARGPIIIETEDSMSPAT